MSYLDMLLYQDRCMTEMLMAPWYGFRDERQLFELSRSFLRKCIAAEYQRMEG